LPISFNGEFLVSIVDGAKKLLPPNRFLGREMHQEMFLRPGNCAGKLRALYQTSDGLGEAHRSGEGKQSKEWNEGMSKKGGERSGKALDFATKFLY